MTWKTTHSSLQGILRQLLTWFGHNSLRWMAPTQVKCRYQFQWMYFLIFTVSSVLLACVASVSVRLSARSMHFSLFWPRENWGERNQKAKNASNGRKALWKRLLRRLQYYHKEWGIFWVPRSGITSSSSCGRVTKGYVSGLVLIILSNVIRFMLRQKSTWISLDKRRTCSSKLWK